MEPSVFVIPLSCYFQNCFCFQDWTYFSGRRKLLTTQNQKGPPLWWKFWKIVGILILIAQKKRPGALNTTQKTPALCKVPFLNKYRKPSIKWHFWKKLYFWQFFLIFQERFIVESWGLLRCIQWTRTLLLSYQNQHSDNFSKFSSKGGPFWFWVVKSLRLPLK